MQHWILYKFVHARYLLAALILFAPVLAPAITRVGAIPQVQERFLKISDSDVSSNTVYSLGFRYTDLNSVVGSVRLDICANSPILGDPCTPPSGFDASAATLFNQSGEVGFSIDNTTANSIVITRVPFAPTAPTATSEYQFNDVINPDSLGTYYGRVQTFSSTDATGPALEDGGLAFVMVRPFDISAEVPPYLLFCAAVTITGFDCLTANSYFIDMGEFSKTSAKAASSEMVGATNAAQGYTISLAGTTLTSGNNLIPALLAPTASSPGNSQFGLNLRANNNPGIGAEPTGPGTANPTPQYSGQNQFKFEAGDAVVSTPTTSDTRKFTVSYITNISPAQEAGIYATTVSFIALANF